VADHVYRRFTRENLFSTTILAQNHVSATWISHVSGWASGAYFTNLSGNQLSLYGGIRSRTDVGVSGSTASSRSLVSIHRRVLLTLSGAPTLRQLRLSTRRIPVGLTVIILSFAGYRNGIHFTVSGHTHSRQISTTSVSGRIPRQARSPVFTSRQCSMVERLPPGR
jgi:hypothetical protein